MEGPIKGKRRVSLGQPSRAIPYPPQGAVVATLERPLWAATHPRTRNLMRYALGASLLLPAMSFVTVFIFYPMAYAISLSFQRYDLSEGKRGGFVGLANYAVMVSHRDFWHGLWLTGFFAGGYVVGCLVIGMLTALLLNQNFRLRGLVRTLLMMPWAIIPVASGLVWVYMLDYQVGVVNYLLQSLHVTSTPLRWLIAPNTALLSVIVASIWQAFPFATVTLLGGLNSISPTLYEAAKTDGANGIQRFRHISLPGLSHVIAVLTILLTVWSLRAFVMIYVMTGGGPAQATETLVVQSYVRAFSFYQFSYGATIGMVVLLFALLLSAFYLAVSKATRDE